MKKNYFNLSLAFLFFAPFLILSQNTYYVSTNGLSTNDGLSQSSAKNIEFLQTLSAGDIVYVKAGNYGERNIVINDSGTSGNEIQIIGYKNTPNDILTTTPQTIRTVVNGGRTVAPTTNNTFDVNYPIDVMQNESPTFIENRLANGRGEGKAVEIRADYIIFKNFQFKYFETGLYIDGNNVTVDNVSSVECGWHDPTIPKNDFSGYKGKAFIIYGDDIKVTNSVSSDAGAEGFIWTSCSRPIGENNYVVTGRNSYNTTDYLFMLGYGVTDGQFENITAENHDFAFNTFHGFVIKAIGGTSANPNNNANYQPTSDTSRHTTRNNFNNSTVINHNIEMQFPETYGNSVTNSTIITAPDFWTDSNVTAYGRQDFFAALGYLCQNASDDILYQNNVAIDCGITFNGWDEAIYHGTAQLAAGQNYNWDNCTFINTQGLYPAIDIRRFGTQSTEWSADHHNWYNCTFYNYADMVIPRRKNSDFNFINCLIDDIQDEQAYFPTPYPIDFDYTNSNLVNGFSVGGSTTSFQPIYESEGTYDLRQATGSPLKGIGVTTPYRSAGSDIGAYQDLGSTNSNVCSSPNPPSGISPVQILVSEHDGNVPCNLMDDDLNTRWSADGDGEWAQFDFGTSQEFDQLQIAFYLGDSRNFYFDIEVSNDAQVWTPVLTAAQGSGTSLALEDFDFPVQNARYVRYLGHGNSQANSDWNSPTEIRIRKASIGVTGITVVPENPTLEIGETENLVFSILPANATDQGVSWSSSDDNIATVDANGTVTAVAAGNATITVTTDDGGFMDTSTVDVTDNVCSSPNPPSGISPVQILVSEHDGNVPCNLMDDDLNTRWSADGDGEWAQFDFGTSQEFDQLQIAFYLGTSQNSFFDVQVSNDASNWTDVLTAQQSSGGTLQLQDFNFPVQNARYVRYLGHGDSQGSIWNSVTEVRVRKVSIGVTGITVAPQTIDLNVGDTGTLTGAIAPTNATNQNMTWATSDSAVATVDQNGTVTAVAAGTATVTATSTDGGFTDSAIVNVQANPVTVNLTPIHDAYLQGSTRFNNNLLRVELGNRVSYLKYDLSSVVGQISSAELQLRVTDDTGTGSIEIHKGTDTNWTESNLSNSNKPSEAALWGTFSNPNQTITYTIPLSVSGTNGGGNLSLIVKQVSGNDFAFAPKEHVSLPAPTLVVTYIPNQNPGLKARIIEEDFLGGTLLYPNPTTDNAVIVFPVESGFISYTINNLAGTLVGKGKIARNKDSVHIDISSVENGIYIIGLSDEKGQNTYLKAVKR